MRAGPGRAARRGSPGGSSGPRRLRSSRSARAFSPLRRSSAPVGSSARSTAGRFTIARAMRHALPLAAAERGREVPRLVGEPELAEQLDRPARGPRTGSRPASSAATAMLSATVRSSSRWKNWKTKPTFVRRNCAAPVSLSRSTRTPATSISPRVGRSRPPIMLSSVDLPPPDGPMIAVIRPVSISRSMSSRAGCDPVS